MNGLHKLIQEASANLPASESLLFELDKVIMDSEIAARRKKPTSKHYKPSQLNCLRMMYFYKSGAKKDENQSRGASDIGILESGSDRHNRIQNWLQKLNLGKSGWKFWDVAQYVKKFRPAGVEVKGKFGNETKCYNALYDLSFMCDGILEWNGKFYVLEIKTENSFKAFKRRGADDKHILQGTCYSISFGIDSVIYLYECRDDCKRKAYEVKIDRAKKEKLVAQIENCEHYLKIGKVPQGCKEPTLCKWCDYQTACRAVK